MVAFSKAENQQLLNDVFGVNQVLAGDQRGEVALAGATPEQRQQYIDARRAFDGQSGYLPTLTSGVRPLNVASLDPFQTQALEQGAAGFNDTGFLDIIRNMLSGAQSGISDAVTPITGDQFTAGIEQYLNPYTQEVVDATVGQIQDQAGINQNNINALFNQGSFGSSAHRVSAQEMADNTERTIAAATAPLYSQGFTNAVNSTLGQFNTDRNASLAGVGMIPGLSSVALQGQGAGQDLFSMNLNNLLNSGNIYQQQNQNLLNSVFGELGQQQAHPDQQLTDMINQITAAFGGGVGPTGSTPNALQSLGGAGMVLGSNFNNLFGGGGISPGVMDPNLPWLR